MIKIIIVLTAGLVATNRVSAEPPVYGSSTDEFDINSISSYLDDDSSGVDSKVLGGGSGSYSYTNYNQLSHSSPTALPYKAPTPSSYPPLPGSTAATAIHPTYGTSSSLTGSNYYSAPSYSSSPVQSTSYGQPLQSGSPYGQPSNHYESHVSFGSDSGSYSTGFKGQHPSSSSFNFPSGGEEAHSSSLNDVRATPQTSYNPSSSPSFSSSQSNYKPQVSFGGSTSSSSYKDPFEPNQSFGSSGSQYSGSFGSDSSSFGSSYNSRPTSSFDSRPQTSSFDSRPSTSSFDSRPSTSFDSRPQTSSFDTRPPTSSFDTRPSPSFDNKPFGNSNFGGFGQETPSGPEGLASPWTSGQSSYPGFNDVSSTPYRNPYNSGSPPYFKDFTSYKGPQADLPYSPNSPYSGFGPRPHPPYSGSYSSRPGGGSGSSYRGKYSSGSKGSRYARHPRPGYSGNRGHSGRQYGPRPSSYRSSGKTPYPPPHSRPF